MGSGADSDPKSERKGFRSWFSRDGKKRTNQPHDPSGRPEFQHHHLGHRMHPTAKLDTLLHTMESYLPLIRSPLDETGTSFPPRNPIPSQLPRGMNAHQPRLPPAAPAPLQQFTQPHDAIDRHQYTTQL